MHAAQARAIIPQNANMLGQVFEKFAGMEVLLRIGAVQTDNDLIDIGGLFKSLDNGGHGRGFKFRIEARQDQGLTPLPGKGAHFIGEFFGVAVKNAVQGRDRAALMEISHEVPRFSYWY